LNIHLYDRTTLMSTINMKSKIMGMYLGKFGREDGCLITTTIEGSIEARILSRRWKYKENQEESESALIVPKKTKIFVEMMNREKDK